MINHSATEPISGEALELSFLQERRFVWAGISGTWTIDKICAMPEPILSECLARKVDLLLIDLLGLASRPITTLDRYRLGASVISFSGKLRKVATIAAPEFIDPDKFGERVARNRGVNVRVFDEMQKAVDWLLGKD